MFEAWRWLARCSKFLREAVKTEAVSPKGTALWAEIMASIPSMGIISKSGAKNS
jgi:hypothetical protein